VLINIKIFNEVENKLKDKNINYNEIKQKVQRFIESLAKGIHNVDF